MAAAICAFVISDPLSKAGHASDLYPRPPSLLDRVDLCVNATLTRKAGRHTDSVARWTPQGRFAARGSRPPSLQIVTVLEALDVQPVMKDFEEPSQPRPIGHRWEAQK